MAGNVWEWTRSWYTEQHPPDASSPCWVPRAPRGDAEQNSYDPDQPQFRVPRRVVKVRFVPVCRQLLPALPPGRAPAANDRRRYQPYRFPLHRRQRCAGRGLTGGRP
jgi:hypothetical protein